MAVGYKFVMKTQERLLSLQLYSSLQAGSLLFLVNELKTWGKCQQFVRYKLITPSLLAISLSAMTLMDSLGVTISQPIIPCASKTTTKLLCSS